MIIVDTTVLVDLLAGEDSVKELAERLLLEDSDWVALRLTQYELGNALRGYVRKGGMAPAVMKEALLRSEVLLLEVVDEIEVGEIWDICLSTGLTYYDASHVWLARSRGLKLRTRDAEVLKKCPDVAVEMSARW